jgi:uncharacterized pyridoxal phosphate-containing UPF0001 family protein
MPDYTSKPENFECLARCRDEVCSAMAVESGDVELSMGMSGDYESAIGVVLLFMLIYDI